MNAQKYGPVYRDKIGNLSYVFVYKPEDVAKVFQAEGKYPARGPALPWKIYREQRKKAKGLLLGEGKEWRKFRSVMDKKLLKVKDAAAYSDRMNDAITDFLMHLDKKRQEDNMDGEIKDLKDSLYKWSFETINTVLYNKKLGTFEDPPNPIAVKFYRSVCLMFDKSNEITLLPPYYKYIKTKRWNDYCKIWDTMFEIAEQLVDEEYQKLQQSISEDSRKSIDLHHSEEIEFLPYVLLRSELNKDEIVGNIMDLMIGGVDTSANTMLWTLYVLGKHPDIQEKLYQEVCSVMKKGEHPNSLSVQKMPYLRGLIKECQRMYPVAIVTARILDKDTVLGGYQIPAKTKVLVGYHMMSFDESFHDEPTKIKPERWIRSSAQHRFNPFGHTAFSFGPRMCVGRRIAELEMQLLISRVIFINFITDAFCYRSFDVRSLFLNVYN
ncbi:uncharacterized protein TRIADDRAFT_25150 [Trichoplax adhaerens]|uniref:Cholesterol side-chain cleavage enzyme, mitochondrial n=1 Tax=Trichoplax adhaerens TaxID=10228 RepID=B3RX38_TRIAD|nr:hypothetical protein TRIADDRAFT_25150 [Trichoplax adhaerens]EDV24803.1 hypothetical protein TRIADDRAFT_25150 [Trichoplax adhaerens]|eukprot:XP_002112693.1 hypothetical protein TRIADDRAFT_25150 [Trichoplax adhaerens]